MTAIAALLGDRRIPAARPVAAGPPAVASPAAPPPSVASLRPGDRVVVAGLGAGLPPATARRLLDLGFAPGAVVEFVRRAPMADPVIVRVADYDIALRRAQARHIVISPLP